ncbi:sulfite exporter TauE/SafE family protein [Bacillus sp. FJAT-42376]|uniref:sulfite exporter TauE/SafE family protein n=1 Tax=Bacillus sp. FJAT-42376 TaxID=2014076 RepID=UPI000F4D2C1D|nr:sulfite exporter TauE/SafE family protein [Bacillus sp. FJAT-42376]AZB44298.1 sulfite exporter TauE/SafE family protein [Bacillus sp. FJAT-42376]
MEWFILILLGLFAGTLGSIVGLGGGIIIVPALLFLSGILPAEITPQEAVGTSLFVLIFTGLSSTLAYMKYKRVDYKSGWIFFIGSGPGSLAGSWVNRMFTDDSFSVWFGLFMIAMAIVLMFKERAAPLPGMKAAKGIQRTYTQPDGSVITYSYQPLAGILIAFAVGFLGGLFGIGGGSLMVPVMVMLFMFPPHVAIGTSMFIIFLSSITSSGIHAAMGNVNWLYAIALIPGAYAGGKLGAYINNKLESKTIMILLRLVLVLVGIRLIYQGIS